MAGKTISQLPLATTPLAGTESVPIVRSGVTYKTTVADIAKSPQDGATANAVVYYNGSKTPASSSAFTFDGTNIAATGNASVGGTLSATGNASVGGTLSVTGALTTSSTATATKLIPTGGTATGNGMYLSAANTLGFSTNGTLQASLDATGNLRFNSGYGSAALAYACRAWVNFDGTGTVTIRASGNVSSITDNGTGDYTVNFTTAMPDANYSVAGGLEGDPSHTAMTLVYNFSRTSNAKVSPTTTALRVQSLRASDSGALDNAIIYVAIFR